MSHRPAAAFLPWTSGARLGIRKGMNSSRHNRTAFRRLAGWLVLCALFLRALVPAGFMPDLGALADGAYPITICSGGFERTILLDKDGNPVDQPAPHASESPCVFAAVVSLALPVLAAILLPLLALAPLARWVPSTSTPVPFPRPPGLAGPRAPPAFA